MYFVGLSEGLEGNTVFKKKQYAFSEEFHEGFKDASEGFS